jgi:formylglycine-generating enzyme required for sulfatase activity
MGSENYTCCEKPVHNVTLSDYYIGKTEVTQELWFTVMRGSYTGQTDFPSGSTANFVGANYPVYAIRWDSIVGTAGNGRKSYTESYTGGSITYYDNGFCYKLSELVNGGPLTDGSRHFCLPTEAEWEYAARGGKNSGGFTYSGSNNKDEVGWCWGRNKVGTKKPNELGIYDMTGNVLEFCADGRRNTNNLADNCAASWMDASDECAEMNYGYPNNVTDPIVVMDNNYNVMCRGLSHRANNNNTKETSCGSVFERKHVFWTSGSAGFRVRCRL